MNIYFAASIRGGRNHADKYEDIIEHLKENHDVLSEHVGDGDLDATGNSEDPNNIHDEDIAWINKADIVIADVTQPSLGVGYEVRHAIHKNKPTLCIYHKQTSHSISAMIQGSKATVRQYNDVDEAKQVVEEFFKQV